MPGLNEGILFPISIFILNVLLAVFRSILLAAVGACFVIYSKYGGPYANSVRWIQHAGFLKMIRTFRHTRKYESSSAKVALVVAFLATIVASFLDKGIAHFIKPSLYIDQSYARTRVITTNQSAPEYFHRIFAGWSTAHSIDDNITYTMTSMLSSAVDTNAIGDEIYSPVISPYTIRCTRFNLSLEDVELTNNGCVGLNIHFHGNTSLGQHSKISSSPDRWSILLSSNIQPYSIRLTPLTPIVNMTSSHPSTKPYCVGVESFRIRPFGGLGAADYNITDCGLTSFPTTTTTKCIHETGDITVISITTTRFTFPDGVFDLSNAKKRFADQSNDLLRSMQETFKNKTIAPSNTPVELWVEIRAMDPSIEVLACSLDYKLHGEDQMLECVYANINAMVVRQPLNSHILTKLGKDSFGEPPLFSTYMTMEYVVNTKNGETSPISLEGLSSNVAEVSEYMARLGSNVYADFDGGKLYIEYDVSDKKLGYEIPLWILLLIGVLLIASILVLLVATRVGSPYNSSLYSVIVKQVPSEGDKSTSRLVMVKFNPLTFDSIPVQLCGDNIGESDPGGAGKTI